MQYHSVSSFHAGAASLLRTRVRALGRFSGEIDTLTVWSSHEALASALLGLGDVSTALAR